MPVNLNTVQRKKLAPLNASQQFYTKPMFSDNPAYTIYADSVLQANKNKNFVQRYLYPESYPVLQTNKIKGFENAPSSDVSTHLMADDPQTKRVYPTIIQLKDGSLKHLSDDEAWDYADKTGEYIQFKTAQEAAKFAANGYKRGNQFLKKK